MNYNFDKVINRHDTDALKWDFTKERFGKENILPLWVADMDFESAPPIVNAITERSKHGIYGYTDAKGKLSKALVHWMSKRHATVIKSQWVVQSPGVVTSVNTAILAFTKPGDRVLLQTPIYYPFYDSIRLNDRVLVENPLKVAEDSYEMDLDHLEKSFKSGVALMVLCSPHNPIGCVWQKDTLTAVIELCNTYNVTLVSDEIHCDLVFSPHTHHSILKLTQENDNIIVFNSPTKTFNIAGLSISNAIIQSKEKREAFSRMLHANGSDMLNIFGFEAAIAAYNESESWLDALLPYLKSNYEFMAEYLYNNIPEILPIRPDATYLAWLDCRKLGIAPEDLKAFFVNEAGVGLNDGITFGHAGLGFQRINFACPRATLEEALNRIQGAVKTLR